MNDMNRAVNGEIAVTRITHSCYLIEIGGLAFLTDPWFSEKPAHHPGEPIALSVADLPDLDGVLISHHHVGHCDLAAFAAYRDKDVPLLVAAPVVSRAHKAGFHNVRPLYPWESTRLGEVTVMAAPARHSVTEITFVLHGGGRTVYFAGDTLLFPELEELAGHFPKFDLLLVPTSGLRLRPLFNRQVVMDAEEAATLTSWLRPWVAVPHHYAATSGPLGDRLITKSDRDPRRFVQAVRIKAPETEVKVLSPGERLMV
jgi:L-ascorbate metabolism protein UlaG (beta-lactamase superfamily)